MTERVNLVSLNGIVTNNGIKWVMLSKKMNELRKIVDEHYGVVQRMDMDEYNAELREEGLDETELSMLAYIDYIKSNNTPSVEEVLEDNFYLVYHPKIVMQMCKSGKISNKDIGNMIRKLKDLVNVPQ